ncbi:MAG: hypothetical protein WC775_03410 [Patescibacteria group bacterium]|jgi:hypothetical protein
MNKFDFWNTWSNVSPIEQKAIDSTIKARELVIQSVPPNALVAIYIKGSFTRREMNSKSDVDMVPIVTETRYEGKVFGVNRPEIHPVMVVPLSLVELRSNALATKSEQSVDLRAKPDRFLRTIEAYKLIYGTPLNPKDFPVRSDTDAYKDDVDILLNGYVPLYLKGEIDFAPLMKKFFWTVEMKLASQGIVVPHTFVGIADGAKGDKLVQEALKLRQQVEITKTEELEFVKKLREYADLR